MELFVRFKGIILISINWNNELDKARIVLNEFVLTIQATAKRPNILIIISDDHAFQSISAYGSKLMQTNSIDRLAREGVIFKKAYVTNSICGPSRAVILTWTS